MLARRDWWWGARGGGRGGRGTDILLSPLAPSYRWLLISRKMKPCGRSVEEWWGSQCNMFPDLPQREVGEKGLPVSQPEKLLDPYCALLPLTIVIWLDLFCFFPLRVQKKKKKKKSTLNRNIFFPLNSLRVFFFVFFLFFLGGQYCSPCLMFLFFFFLFLPHVICYFQLRVSGDHSEALKTACG